MVVLFTTSFVGCSSSSFNGVTTAPTIKDLKVSVEDQIKEGQYAVMCWFKNDSKFTITYLQIHYKIKSGITKKDIVAKYDYSLGLGEDYTIDKVFMDFIVGDQYQNEYYKDDVVEVKPGETSPRKEFYRNKCFSLKDIAEFENVSPDIMTIRYLDKKNV